MLAICCSVLYNASMHYGVPAMVDKPIQLTGRARGGRARADALTKEQRSALAKTAAEARWDEDIPTASHIGELKIGDLALPCAVLPDGTRLISQGGMTTAFGPVLGGWQS